MRPTGTTKTRLPITGPEFNSLILKTKRDKSLKSKQKYLLAYTLLFASGCRVSEIVAFTKEDLIKIRDTGVLALTNSVKNSLAGDIYFSQRDKEAVAKLIPKDDGYIFHKNGSSKPMSVKGLTQNLNKHLKKCLGEQYTTHSFRSGLATMLEEIGTPPKVIQTTLRHTKVETYLNHYAKPTTNSLIQAKESISKVRA
jgi:integrase